MSGQTIDRLRVKLPPLHPGQLEVVHSDARFKVLAAGRRWRKSSLGVQMVLATALQGGRAWWVGPTFPVARIGWRFLKSMAHQIPDSVVQEAELTISFPGGGDAQIKSAENPDSLRGSGLDGVVVDEAAYVKEEAWFESLRPALSDRIGWAMFISSPNGFNWFYKLFEQAGHTPGWARWQRPTWDNPYIDRAEIELARAELGGVIFRQEYGAEFLDIGSMKPFHRDWIRYWGTDEDPAPNVSDLAVEAGFDPAISERDGASRSALVVAGQMRRGGNRGRIYVLEAKAGHWTAYEQAAEVLKSVRQWKIRTVRVEKVAYQAAFGSILDRESRTAGLPINIELIPPDRDKVRRANAWAPFVEDGTVLLGPGQMDLVTSMLEVPQDESKWDLVDAAGLVVRGFPVLQGESQTIPGMTASDMTRAKSYAVRPERNYPVPPRASWPGLTSSLPDGVRRAVGYAVRTRGKPLATGVR